MFHFDGEIAGTEMRYCMRRKFLFPLWIVLVALVFSWACGAADSAEKPDYSHPGATFKTLKTAIADWDSENVLNCLAEPEMAPQNRSVMKGKLEAKKDWLQSCLQNADLGDTVVNEHDYLGFILHNCAKQGKESIAFTVTGSGWKVAKLLPEL